MAYGDDANLAPESLPPGVSVVVPVYNSAATLGELVTRVESVLASLGCEFELILVNDGSRDASWPMIEELGATRPWLRGVCMMRNYGQHNALLCGIRAARFDTIVTIDDDLQHPPEEISKLLAKLNEGFDVVYGAPEAMPHSIFRNVLSRGIKKVLGMTMGISGIVDINAFRAFRTQVRRGFDRFQSPNPMIDILLSWGTSRFASIRVRHEPRKLGRSQYTILKLFNQAMLLITGFSTAPLRFSSLVGFGFTLFGIGVLVYVLARYLIHGTGVPGFPFLASVIAIFSGAQLFALGIMGEYLARMFNRTMERPGYIVRQSTNAPSTASDAVQESAFAAATNR